MRRWMIGLAALASVTSGCTTSGPAAPELQARLEEQAREIQSRQQRIEALESTLSSTESQVGKLSNELDEARQAQSLPAVSAAPTSSGELLPPRARPGECYARVWVPASYETEQVRVLTREASARIETVPARYEWTTERVTVKEASERLEVVPATYETLTERVLVKPAATRLVEVPAVYGWEEEKVLDRPAHTVWKKGRGPIERVDNATGEIMCLVDVPATYKTVRKRVLKTPATTREVEIPAEYKTVTRRVQKTPPTTRKIEIPAEYKTMRVRKLVAPASTRSIEIPEKYRNVTRRKLVRDGQMEWRSILCETNASPGVVTEIQRALKQAGHDPGPIDGQIGRQTIAAVKAFQAKKGLPSGHLTTATLDALGVRTGR